MDADGNVTDANTNQSLKALIHAFIDILT